jgi:hypothetical protein
VSDPTFQDARTNAIQALREIISSSEDTFFQVVASGKVAPITIAALQLELDNIKNNAKAAIAALEATKEVL